jgi:hypothetical protein
MCTCVAVVRPKRQEVFISRDQPVPLDFIDRVRLVCIQHLYYRVPGVVQVELLRFEDVGLVCLDTPHKFRTTRFPAMVSDSLERTPPAPEFKMGTSG